MSSLLEMLGQQLGGDTLKQLSGAIGADEQTTEKALSAALPALMGGLAKNASSEQGAAALYGAIERDHDGGMLDNMSDRFGGNQQQANAAAGAGILKHVFGGNERRVESGVSQASGLSQDATAKLLQMVAPVLLGALGRQQRQQGLNASGLGQLLGQERQQFEQQSPQGAGLIGKLLDTDGDGDLDMSDLLAHGARFFAKK